MAAATVQRISFFLFFGILVLASSPVAAQRRNSPKLNSAKVHGSVIAVGNGLLKVKSKHGNKDEWVIKPQGVSQFLANAKKDWLRPGVVVMVTSQFDEQGKAPFPVAMLQAFTPRPGRVLGMVEDPSTAVEGADKSAPKTYILAGPIKSIEDGNLTISVGRKDFVVPLMEEVEVSVDLINDLSFVREGDEFEGTVKFLQKGKAFGAELRVTAKELLEPPPPAPLTKKERLAQARREKAEAAKKAKAEAESGQSTEAGEESE